MKSPRSRDGSVVWSGPWIVTGLGLGLVALVVALMATLPWGVPADVLRIDLPRTRYVLEHDIEWEETLDLMMDHRGVVWVGSETVTDVAATLRSYRAATRREWVEDGQTYSEAGAVRVHADRGARWADVRAVCAAAIEAGFGGAHLRCRTRPGDRIAWLELGFLDRYRTGYSRAGEPEWAVDALRRRLRIPLRSADRAAALRVRETLARRHEAAGDTYSDIDEPIVELDLPHDLTVQDAVSLLECYLARDGMRVDLVGIGR